MTRYESDAIKILGWKLNLTKIHLIEELLVYGEIKQELGFLAVTIHPLADEIELLEHLQVSPEKCRFCDLYWVFQDDMFFVGTASVQSKHPVVTYHHRAGIQHGHSFYVQTNVYPLNTQAVKNALEYLAIWITDHQAFLKNHEADESKKVIKIIETDICVE